MSTLTIELPEVLTETIMVRRIPVEEVQSFVVEAIEGWLYTRPEYAKGDGDQENRSRFRESAVLFADRLINENRALFDRLAQL
jgi:hypothetical protein